MKILANIEKEEVLEIEKIFGRLNSLHNLSVTLAANNMLFEEKSDFYAKVIKDLEETQQKYDAWWQKIVCKCNRGKSGTKGVPVKTAYARYDIKKYIGVYESRRVQGQEGSGL